VDVDAYVNEAVKMDEEKKTMVEVGNVKVQGIRAIILENEEGTICACVNSMMHETEEGIKVSRVGAWAKISLSAYGGGGSSIHASHVEVGV
jgi:hypothetical protein